jgi:uncharacterized protein with GYD domain
MGTYISLIDYTETGARSIEGSPDRADAFVQAAREAGVEVREVYWTFGGHDGVLILEAPDDKSVSTLLLSLSRSGMVRTHTLRAYDRAEMKEILDRSSEARQGS